MATNISLEVPTEEEEEESEWEHEYHETETEDFYITLDLSSHSRQFAHGIKNSSTNSASQNTKPPVPAFDPPNPPHESDNARADGTHPNEYPDAPASALDPALTTSSNKRKRIQIADLHTRNPLISYNSQLYSCDWTTTIGTDMFFATAAAATTEPNPEPEPEPESEPEPSSARPAPSPPQPPSPHATLLATTRIKLSAHPVQVTPRPNPIPSAPNASTTTDPPPPATTSALEEETLIIPLPPNAKPTRRNQAAFLTRLINIKRAKGERDEVNVYAGSREGLQRGGGAGAAGGAEGDGEGDGAEVGDGGGNDGDSVYMPNGSPMRGKRGSGRARSRGRGSGRGGMARKKIAGGVGASLDYGGSGEMASAQQTPERWDDLGRPGDPAERSMAGEDASDAEESGAEGAMDWMH